MTVQMRWCGMILVMMLFTAGNIPVLYGEELPPESSAENVLPPPATLTDMMKIAVEQNPGIRAARKQWRATVEKYRVATAYPDPQLMVTWFPEPVETRLGPQDWNATLTQMIPFPGKLSTAGDIVEAEARLARLNLDKAVRETMVAVSESWYELRYIRQASEIAAKNAAILEQFRSMGESAYARNRAAFADVIRAQSRTGQIRYDMLLLEELARTEQTRLNSLLNREPDAHFGEFPDMPVQPVVYKLEELYRMAETYQDEIQMADAEIEKADAGIRMASYGNLPDFRLGIFYAGIGQPDVAMPPSNAGDDAVGIQFGVTIPLWSGAKKSRVAQAEAMAEGARAMKTARVNQTRTRIHTLYFKLGNALRLIALYRDDLLPQALRAMETAETWFREGEGSFSDFAETQATAYNFQLSLARAAADYGKLLAGLERLTGQPLTVRAENPDAEKGEK